MNTALLAAALIVGIALGLAFRYSTILRLRKRMDALRSSDSENPAVDMLSTHEKYLYYKMLDDLEKGTRVHKAQKKSAKKGLLRSVTEFLFVTAQIFALGWVSVSYGIAVYSTVVLMQPFPATELSQQAIDTILKVMILKVVGNIFEHNDGPVFGTSKQEENMPPDTGGGEGVG